ncbi:putative pyridoxal kinase [Ophidiomyces ophidiicola]|uniref:Pyridoxal kinase n=1 Tax=Ophidiomyces ophidiicola TaxID=1387563 RepID=A0ACB8UPF7_9EURO|nr:putative pyridoxal kinase [Ophidiomyces ophidiicola]KAI1916847.1 putative pyridoxal kinase [Ophidiomyces ophidiicola]KAI1917008.1 putative pyridoxal kinase [Ophidiomyces ophidiicola]KAI1926723.1 putative pyridoxal kinase [Ophidiomyces ophidiicola]KAI1947682.1 putative pyridoxal kinase [Ophidiomyces ophidiicola]KAI1948704.1 putative pyridoxal kinase [Ophidiomyces ophidiicola]
MATFVMQSLGCEVAALNTVNFSNHTGYGQITGTKASAQEITALYHGLRQSYLTDFDVLLTGYAPSAAAVEAVGAIGRELQQKSASRPGSFFWILDPVMGDQGRIYVNEDVVPAYKSLIPHADLILPNQFEAELLSGITIKSLADLAAAIAAIHRTYHVPHVIVTSVQLPTTTSTTTDGAARTAPPNTLVIIGSTVRSDGSPRLFKVDVPCLDCFFSGTGDMFAALMVARLREAVFADNAHADAHAAPNTSPLLRETPSWVSPDRVAPADLPLAKATEKVLASMNAVLERTMAARARELAGHVDGDGSEGEGEGVTEAERERAAEKRARLRRTKAAEVRLVRNVDLLKNPKVKFFAQECRI